MFTTGAESDIWDFDGGDGNDPGAVPPTTYTGAMWEADSDFAGRSPMHPGNISGSSPLKNLAETENYGEGNHALVQAELPNVNWNLNVNSLSQAPGAGAQDGLLYQQPGTGSGNVAVPPSLIVSSGGTNTPHQTVHPVRGVWIIRRTARAYYTAP
jgi:microcystin-dependent protein